EKNPYLPWDWGTDGLSSNHIITPKIVEKYIDEDWDFGVYGLSSNPNMTPRFIEKTIDRGWCFLTLSSNPGINDSFAKKYIDKYGLDCEDDPCSCLSLHILATNPSITPQFFKRYSKNEEELIGYWSVNPNTTINL